MNHSLALRSHRILTPSGLQDGILLVRDGRVEGIFSGAPDGCLIEDVGAAVVMPGLVDGHVHINEPGRTEWEGFETATRAAATGGITTLADMPLNSEPVTTTPEALQVKQRASAGKRWIDVGLHAGLVPGNLGALPTLLDAGVLGVKAFMVDSGIATFPPVTEDDLRAAMPLLARSGTPLLVHAEVDLGTPSPPDHRRYGAYLASRPPSWEVAALRRLVDLCRETGCRVHIVHLACAEGLPILADARAEGLPITVETCPHYLYFTAEHIPDGDTRFKCAPPIREQTHQEALWQGLREGVIDLVASDHSPAPPSLKTPGDFVSAWGGIASLQLSLAATWTQARARGFGLSDIASWMSTAPARLLGLAHRKGRLAPGYDADIIVWHPEEAFTVRPQLLHHRHKLTPYEGETLFGTVEMTFLRGKKIYEHGRMYGSPQGVLVTRNA